MSVYILLQSVGNVKDKFFCLFPTEAGISNGLAVYALFSLLSAVFDVAFDHKTLDEAVQIVVVTLAVKNFLSNTDLFKITLVGVGVVAVDDNTGVYEA